MISTAEKVIKIIADEACCEPESISTVANFVELDLDSLEFVNVISQCEKEFNIRIDDVAVYKIDIVSDLITKVEELICESQSK